MICESVAAKPASLFLVVLAYAKTQSVHRFANSVVLAYASTPFPWGKVGWGRPSITSIYPFAANTFVTNRDQAFIKINLNNV